MEFRNETSMEVYTSPSSCIYSKNYKILMNCFRTSENGIYTIMTSSLVKVLCKLNIHYTQKGLQIFIIFIRRRDGHNISLYKISLSKSS